MKNEQIASTVDTALQEDIRVKIEPYQKKIDFDKKEITKDQIMKILRKLTEKLRLLKKLGVDLKEFSTEDCFSEEPYKRQNSRQLFQMAKRGDFQGVRNLISKDKFLVYSVDYVNYFYTN